MLLLCPPLFKAGPLPTFDCLVTALDVHRRVTSLHYNALHCLIDNSMQCVQGKTTTYITDYIVTTLDAHCTLLHCTALHHLIDGMHWITQGAAMYQTSLQSELQFILDSVT